jgi:hypothetical protein
MILAESRGRFLYEVRPDLFPYDYLTHDEMLLWEIFYEERKRQRSQKMRADG